VTVDNPREFGQADYSDDDVNVVPQHFPEGNLELDGYEAVAYGRIREGSTDFDRIEPKNVLAYAAQAVRLVRLATGDDLSAQTRSDLSQVTSPRTGLRADRIFDYHLNRTWTWRPITK